ncbi:unnamed protein product [Camellia sinensis]
MTSREAICSSLENYNKQIEQLKQEMNNATNTYQESILDLQKQLTLLGGQSKESNGTLTEEESITSMTPTDKIRSQLDDAIASKCPFCGDLMIREISLPFILPWRSIRGYFLGNKAT